MLQVNLYDLFTEALQRIATDIIDLLPKIFLTLIVLVIAFLAIRLLNGFFGKILRVIDLDNLFERLVKVKLPFSLIGLIILLIDIGIILIALFGLADFFLVPQQMELVKEILGYISRIIGVIAITILTFVMFNILIEKVTLENKMRGYVMFILLILITMMVFDLANLSDSTKKELEGGLSLGLGIAVGVFAIWFFFHDYLDKLLSLKKEGTKK